MKEERAFCKTACHARALLSTYGCFTSVQLDIRDADVCRACTTRECVKAECRDRFDHGSCPSLVRPFARQPGDECVLCLQCAKVCPRENIGLGLVRASGSSRRARLLTPAEAAFIALATGFVAHEVIGEAKTLESLFHRVPERLFGAMPVLGFGWWEAIWFLAIFPSSVWSSLWVVSLLLTRGGDGRRAWLAAATAAAPIVAVAHAGKALAKLAAWAGYLPGALADPQGMRTLEALTARTVSVPSSLCSLPPLGWTMLVAVIVIAWRTRAHLRELLSEFPVPATVAPLTLVVFYGGVFVAWVWR